MLMTNLFCVYIKQHEELQNQKAMLTKGNNPKMLIELRSKIDLLKT